MSVTLTIKKVPEAIAARLRAKAERNRRSLQRELLTIIEGAVACESPPLEPLAVAEPRAGSLAGARSVGGAGAQRAPRAGRSRRLTLEELWERARRIGLPAAAGESAAIIRRLRDERHGH